MERHRIHADGALYYVTFSVVDWLPVFVSEAACRIVTESLNFCHKQKSLRINAFVVMPTHLHAIVFDSEYDAARLERTLTDFRKFTGRSLCDFAASHLPACFSEVFRNAAGADRERRFWQPSRHPVIVESESFWQQKLDYLHENPCRKGLVVRAVDWRFSSASYWLSEGQIASKFSLHRSSGEGLALPGRPSVESGAGSGDPRTAMKVVRGQETRAQQRLPTPERGRADIYITAK